MIDPVPGGVERQRKSREVFLVDDFAQFQKYCKACSRESDVGGVYGNVVSTDVRNIGGSEAKRSTILSLKSEKIEEKKKNFEPMSSTAVIKVEGACSGFSGRHLSMRLGLR